MIGGYAWLTQSMVNLKVIAVGWSQLDRRKARRHNGSGLQALQNGTGLQALQNESGEKKMKIWQPTQGTIFLVDHLHPLYSIILDYKTKISEDCCQNTLCSISYLYSTQGSRKSKPFSFLCQHNIEKKNQEGLSLTGLDLRRRALSCFCSSTVAKTASLISSSSFSSSTTFGIFLLRDWDWKKRMWVILSIT